jgi:hypothetical protein
MPVRVQLRRTRGWRKPDNTVVVSRPSRWGNPYTVADYGRDEAIRLYAERLRQNPRLVEEVRRELRGRNLACWCAPDLACHADVLLAVANDQDFDLKHEATKATKTHKGIRIDA